MNCLSILSVVVLCVLTLLHYELFIDSVSCCIVCVDIAVL